MPTQLITVAASESYASATEEAARALRGGELVVFPTETVYGVGANAAHADAMQRLRALKTRESTQAFTVHLGERTDARRFLSNPSAVVRRLIRKAWPGPLTLVCEEAAPEHTECARRCPPELLGGMYREGTIGLRCPDHPVAAQLLRSADCPVVASSANERGQAPPLDAQQALRAFDGRVAYVLDGGPTRHNTASTIVEVRGHTWKVLRKGAMDERAIERLARSEILLVCTGNTCRSPMAQALFRRELAQRLGLAEADLAGQGYHVQSAGTAGGGDGASSGAVEEMRRRGIDIGSHKPRPLTPELINRAERVYVMSPEHLSAVRDMAPSIVGRAELLDAARPIQDPFGGSAEDYRRCAEQILAAVRARVEEFVHEDRNW